jgi:hypothetical protein
VSRADDQVKSEDCYYRDDDYARDKILFLHYRNLVYCALCTFRWLTIKVSYR